MNLIFATHNPNKLLESKAILSNDSINLKGLHDIDYHEEIIESGTSLRENAAIKARTIYNKFNCNVFSEDTGLEVFALDMEPGVYTARYAGQGSSSMDNMNKLLSSLKGINDRRARFRTVVCLILEGKELFFEGLVNGNIAESLKGKEGFGYDPIFIPEDYVLTFAELPKETKNSISHRKRAIAKLSDYIKKNR